MRIRTIKPEFWISESMGRLTRDTRLVFVGLWSVADDHGRFRADPRYLAGQLFPYDTDGVVTVSRALASLREEGSVVLYEVDRSRYGAVTGWKTHQKIDRPSASRIPQHPETPLANVREPSSSPRESSCEDQGSGNRDQGTGSREAPPPVDRTKSAELHQHLEAPTTATSSWDAQDFWRWFQVERRRAGHLVEKWPKPRALSDWWAEARSSAEISDLQAGVARWAGEHHWQTANPPLPWAGWASQWARFTRPEPRGHARPDEDAYLEVCQLAREAGETALIAQLSELRWVHDEEGIVGHTDDPFVGATLRGRFARAGLELGIDSPPLPEGAAA